MNGQTRTRLYILLQKTYSELLNARLMIGNVHLVCELLDFVIIRVKVVLIGQDPYHSPRQATGLSFSVPASVQIPSSLKNIYKEIKSDMGYDAGSHGNLAHWAEQVTIHSMFFLKTRF